jgi:hypothetical protein
MALCFKDMTFCDSKDCVTPLCARRLTHDVWADAKKWRGSADAPVAISDFTTSCPDYRKRSVSLT